MMNYVKKQLRAIGNFFGVLIQLFFLRWFEPTPSLFVCAVTEEIPDRPKPSTVYLCGENGNYWAAALLCPCGCGETIQLNLLTQARPCWSVQQHADGVASIMPSVWRKKGCGSHFFIRNGRVDWC